MCGDHQVLKKDEPGLHFLAGERLQGEINNEHAPSASVDFTVVAHLFILSVALNSDFWGQFRFVLSK